MIVRCDIIAQYNEYKSEILSAMQQVLESGKYILGPQVKKFEEEFAKYVGVPFGIGVANATDGLILALKALGIKEGDEVVTTPFSAIPTVSAIVATGAVPVFVDVDPHSFLMDLNLIKSALSTKTKVIMPVHIFGNMTDVDQIRKIV
jgi:dTDP-4-amino-4,6-dideoxygalactose transaminase